MIRGTTPTITFKIKTDLDLNTIDTCYVTFKSLMNGKVKEYDTSTLIIDPELKTIEVVMSQEDTLFLNTGVCKLQIRLKTTDGLAYASDIQSIDIQPILKEGVI